MYEKKSIFAYLSGSIIGAVLAFLIPFILSMCIGGGYAYYFGIFLALPLLANAFIGYLKENYRYKWKTGKRFALTATELAIAVVFTLIFVFVIAEHVMTEYEKLLLCIGVFLSSFLTQALLSRTEKYRKVLEDILGFKEFITATEGEKVKFMLEENPELFYDVLPYAQVLGVTNEWESKFADITIKAPSYYYGGSVYDYYIFNRCMRRASISLLSRPQQSSGTRVGRSGGGGRRR